MKTMKLSDSVFEDREGYERSVLLSSEDFGANTKLQLMRLGPGQNIKPHHHTLRTECFKIVSGEGLIKINGNDQEHQKTILFYANPETHEFINTSATTPPTFLVIRTNDPGGADMIWG